jgi:hypothetical protein
MTSKTDIQADVDALVGLTDADLETELGRRLEQTNKELTGNEPLSATRGMGPTVDRAVLMAVPASVRKIAERFLTKFNRQMYSLICDDTDPDHAQIQSAAAQGANALGYAISGALVVSFGWLPGIATVIAVIIAKRAAKAGYQAFCETWKEQL